MRKIILSLVGVAIVVAAFFGYKALAGREKPQPKAPPRSLPAVFTDTVSNRTEPIVVTANGSLAAKYRLQIFSEVQGIFQESSREFKPGVYYPKGELLLRINSDEHRANLRAQKSNLYNQLVLLLPDLRLDYPEAFPNWDAYVRKFDMERSLRPLPEFQSEREKLFITGRNLFTTWYTVKNLEERLTKYDIYAPFSGVLTEALVTPGVLIRPGQPLGTLINTGTFELEAAVPAQYVDYLQIGKSVELHNLERTKTWRGRVVRINKVVDQSTQTVPTFIQVSGDGLRENMYLEAQLSAREEPNVYELSRKLLFDEDKLYVLRDSVLATVQVEPVYFKDKTVLVRGLSDGTPIVARPVPGAYEGMVVKVAEN